MSIQIGDKAPDFKLVTISESGPEVFQLSQKTGEKNMLLLFVPMAFTGGCTEEFCSITKNINDYQSLDAEVIGISGDNPFAQQAWAEKEGIKLTLLSDYEHSAAKDYGISYESFIPDANLIMGGVAKRSAFVIDKEGVVQYAEVLENPHDMPDFEAIKKCLSGL